MQKIFISHSSKDKLLVEALVNVLLDNGCQIDRADIYCSSLEGMKTLPGDPDFIRDLHKKMQSAKLIILMLSPNYYDSQYCLAELGATWILDVLTFPIVIPPLKVGEIKGILQVTQVGSVNDELHLDRLRDAAIEACGIQHKNTDNWSRQRIKFVDQLLSLLDQLPKPTQISPEEFKHVQERVNAYKQERDEAHKEVERLTQLIEDLKKAKDATEVSAIVFESLTEYEQFEALTNDIKDQLSGLSYIATQQAIYYGFKGEALIIDAFNASNQERLADQAVDEGYLTRGEGRDYSPNPEDDVIQDIMKLLNNLEDFLTEISTEFSNAFRKKHSYKPDLKNIRFWEEYLFAKNYI